MLTYTADQARVKCLTSLQNKGLTRLDMLVKRIDNAITHAIDMGMSFTSYKISHIDWICNKQGICDMLDIGEYRYVVKDDDSGIYHEILISW